MNPSTQKAYTLVENQNLSVSDLDILIDNLVDLLANTRKQEEIEDMRLENEQIQDSQFTLSSI
jgi:hypothetical protein